MDVNNGLSVISEDRIALLKKFPIVLQENQTSAMNATTAVMKMLRPFDEIDMKEIDATEMEAKMGSVRKVRVVLGNTVEKMESKRMPITSFFDEARSMCTKEEKAVNDLIAIIKRLDDNWEKEKGRRALAAAALVAAEVEKRQDAIRIKSAIQSAIETLFITRLQGMIKEVNDRYNKQPGDKLEAYGEELKKWAIAFKWSYVAGFAIPVASKHHSPEDIAAFIDPIKSGLEKRLSLQWDTDLDAERNRLVLMIPSRIVALQTDAAAEALRIQTEENNRATSFTQRVSNAQAQISTQAQADQANAIFDVASTAQVVVDKSSGTVVKKVYKPSTMAAWVAIVQSFMMKDFPSMSMEDIEKKFGFMRLKAQDYLNQGVELSATGLLIEEDYSTRAQSKKGGKGA